MKMHRKSFRGMGLFGAGALAAIHGHMHGGAAHEHHRKAAQLAARDSGNTPFALDIINNMPNDDVHLKLLSFNVTGNINQLSMPDFLSISADGDKSWWA